jgi:hypothetical protein
LAQRAGSDSGSAEILMRDPHESPLFSPAESLRESAEHPRAGDLRRARTALAAARKLSPTAADAESASALERLSLSMAPSKKPARKAAGSPRALARRASALSEGEDGRLAPYRGPMQREAARRNGALPRPRWTWTSGPLGRQRASSSPRTGQASSPARSSPSRWIAIRPRARSLSEKERRCFPELRGSWSMRGDGKGCAKARPGVGAKVRPEGRRRPWLRCSSGDSGCCPQESGDESQVQDGGSSRPG